MEASHSGLVRLLGKQLWGKLHRRFESSRLRQLGFREPEEAASLPACAEASAGKRSAANLYGIFWRKGKGFINKGKRKFSCVFNS